MSSNAASVYEEVQKEALASETKPVTIDQQQTANITIVIPAAPEPAQAPLPPPPAVEPLPALAV